jgi:hypothetical protein
MAEIVAAAAKKAGKKTSALTEAPRFGRIKSNLKVIQSSLLF